MNKEVILSVVLILGMVVILVTNAMLFRLINSSDVETDKDSDSLYIGGLTIEECKQQALVSEDRRVRCNELGLELVGYGGFLCIPRISGDSSECNPLLERYQVESRILESCEENFPSEVMELANCLSHIEGF